MQDGIFICQLEKENQDLLMMVNMKVVYIAHFLTVILATYNLDLKIIGSI
jgi:hypothetical protein